MKYRIKPIEVEAVQFSESQKIWLIADMAEWPTWFKEAYDQRIIEEGGSDYIAELEIRTPEVTMIAKEGDYIIKGINGEIYAMQKDMFEKTHEKV